MKRRDFVGWLGASMLALIPWLRGNGKASASTQAMEEAASTLTAADIEAATRKLQENHVPGPYYMRVPPSRIEGDPWEEFRTGYVQLWDHSAREYDRIVLESMEKDD